MDIERLRLETERLSELQLITYQEYPVEEDIIDQIKSNQIDPGHISYVESFPYIVVEEGKI